MTDTRPSTNQLGGIALLLIVASVMLTGALSWRMYGSDGQASATPAFERAPLALLSSQLRGGR